ncbi:hypothetical protein [Gynurincola endophyticus]|uniref:hypothetical protein n=1 Tax=Gynurincola endophyticus TaxID=2479004 RepID=UPI000F8DFE19|nr:hypothetical protein [Gynurincola endophyticus]
MNFKDQKQILILQHPEEFEPELKEMQKVTTVITSVRNLSRIEFVLIFVKTSTAIENTVKELIHKIEGDGILWFAYPKGISGKYKVEINRDNGWESPGNAGYETVRAVSIDEDWSALRFRKVQYIKNMNRQESFAMTKEGKGKTKK